MSLTIPINTLALLHHDSIIRWENAPLTYVQQDFLGLVEKNHSFNYQLWHAEDKARRDDKGYEYVYRAKREIDNFNQQRNNAMEKMDEWLFTNLNPASPNHCPVHSETPGMIIDRLSIIALKAYHMHIQAIREDTDTAHRERCQEKLRIILLQQHQLYACLEQLLNDVSLKKRTFQVYYQFKMYNDPTLNPELYN